MTTNNYEIETQNGGLREAISSLDENDLVGFALELAKIESPPGHDAEMARIFHMGMRNRGIDSFLQPVSPGQYNVIGTYEGTGGGRTLMFNGHLHSCRVPFTEAEEAYGFKDLFSVQDARIVDGKWIYGDGIANMKGSLAAYVAAVRAIKDAGVELAGDVVISGVVGTDEFSPVAQLQGAEHQGFGVGVKHLITHGGVADMCVVGEPTGLKLVTQHFGATRVRIDVVKEYSKMRSCNDVEEDFSEWIRSDSIAQLSKIVEAVRAWIPDYQKRNTIDGAVPAITFLSIEGGQPTRPPISPFICSIFVDVRTRPDVLPISVKDEIRKVVSSVDLGKNFRVRVELYATVPGPSVPVGSPLVAALHAAHSDFFAKPVDLATVQWYSDAAHINRYGIPSINYGPGGGKRRPGSSLFEGEHINIGDLVDCTKVYIDLILRLCGTVVFDGQ